jgi:signal transduction histidine kinase
MRRGFLWRTGCLAAAVLSVGTLGLLVLVWHVASALGLSAGGAGGVALLTTFAAVVLLAIVLVGRTVRRFAVPFGDLIEAAGRVEAGDYSARVRERPWGPLPVQALVRAFNGMAAHLETDERQRRTLLADISHELRTPLSVVQGEIEAMLDGVHAADEEHLGAALDETRVLARLIEDLRTLALAEAGTLALHREATDPNVLVEEVVRAFGPTAASAGVSISLDVDDDAPLIDIDPVRIREVLSNVLANGLRYAPRGSTVHVGVHVGDNRRGMRFAVEDAGPGMPPELRANVFERFAKSAESRGSGLGLAIARQLVEAHGGTIEAASPPGGGTRISFELPLGTPES